MRDIFRRKPRRHSQPQLRYFIANANSDGGVRRVPLQYMSRGCLGEVMEYWISGYWAIGGVGGGGHVPFYLTS